MSDLIALAEKTESGVGRELDGEIDAAIFGGRAAHTFTEASGGARLRRSYGPGVVFFSHDPESNGGHVLTSMYRTAGAYTASLDAAVDLVERVLPLQTPDLMREALSALGRKHHWHICLKKPEQIAELPGALVSVALRAIAALADQKTSQDGVGVSRM